MGNKKLPLNCDMAKHGFRSVVLPPVPNIRAQNLNGFGP